MVRSRRSQRLQRTDESCESAVAETPSVAYEPFEQGLDEFQIPKEDSADLASSSGKLSLKRPLANVGVATCYEANTQGVAWTVVPPPLEHNVPMCRECVNFARDRNLNKRLQKAKDQFDEKVGRSYHCSTLWMEKQEQRGLSVCSSPVCPKKVKESPHDNPIITPLLQLSTPEKCVSSFPVDMKKKASTTQARYTPAILDKQTLLQDALASVVEKHQQHILYTEAMSKQKFYELKNEHLKAMQELKSFHLLSLQILNKSHEEQLQKERDNVATNVEEEVKKRRQQIEDQYQAEVRNLQSIITTLQDRLKQKGNELSEHERHMGEYQKNIEARFVEVPESEASLAPAIEQLVEKTFEGKRVQRRTKIKHVVEVTWSQLYSGDCKAEYIEKAEPIVRENNPYRKSEEILRVMDVEGCRINLRALDHLRKGVEVKEDGSKPKRGENWLATPHSIKKIMSSLESAADEVIPYEILDTALGIDGISFDKPKLFRFILRLYCLEDVALDGTKSPIQFAITLDGADLSRNCSHVTAGLKIVDPRAVDPESGLPIGLIGSRKMQSRELCIVFKMLLSRDSKALYDDHFADFFAFFHDVAENGFEDIPPGRFLISSPQDMSSFWKSLKKGGACKVSTQFCHCCSCKSADCNRPRLEKCARCVQTGRENCFHHDVADKDTLARLADELSELKETHGFLSIGSDVLKNLRVRLSPDETEKHTTMSNIEYQPRTNADSVRFGSAFINHDLGLLGLPKRGELEDRRQRLHLALTVLERIKGIEAGIAAGDYSAAHILIEQAIPCIMHCENRM